ncbi:4'-phosphopantetheinyl transferase family protein [Nocardiopsis salina]|uniref:4'-phosphopantetheinyl transferase family protein n=1 Tax=Nocardiopsis salina TaxID=245836 RepID=UPI0023AA0E1A|nr:4'-phosphopantetheinyl transferase superfamily protein [Nocardiopsis salina]
MPGFAASAEAFDDGAHAPLFPEEETLMAGRQPRRRRQFATSRACARRALSDLGVQSAPILPGRHGEPRWPAGVVGSITHCDGYRAAVVARSGEAAAVGIDAEPGLPLPEGVRSLVASPREAASLARLGAREPRVPWDRLLFSAKEAAYKAWFPQARRWCALRDVSVQLGAGGTFTAVPPTLCPEGAGYEGRWLLHAGLLVTAVLCPADAPGLPPETVID